MSKRAASPYVIPQSEAEKLASDDNDDNEGPGNASQDVSDLLLLASISKQQTPIISEASSNLEAVPKSYSVQALESQLLALKAELEEQKNTVTQLRCDLKEQKSEASNSQYGYEKELARLKRENEDLRNDTTLLKNTNKVLTDSLVQSQSLQKAVPNVDSITPEEIECRVQQGVEMEKMSLQSVFDAAQEEYLSRIQGLKTTVSTLETRNGAMKSKMKDLLQDLDRLRISDSKNTDWKNKFFAEVAKSDSLAKEVLQLKGLSAKFEKEKKELESTLSSFSHRTMELEAKGHKELRETKGLLEKSVHEAQLATADKVKLETLLQKSQSSLDDLSTEKDLLKTSIEQLLKRIASLEDELSARSLANTELKKSKFELTHKMSVMEETMEDLTLGNQQELRIWKRRVEELKDTMSTMQKNMDSLPSQEIFDIIQSDLAHKDVELVKMQESIRWLTEKNAELEKELSNLFDGQQSECQSDTREMTHLRGYSVRAIVKCRELNSKLMQAESLALEASSKVERLLAATANSIGASSSSTLADMDFSPSDLEENISATFVSLTCSNSRAEKIVAKEKLSGLLTKLYLAHFSQPSSPSGQSSPPAFEIHQTSIAQ